MIKINKEFELYDFDELDDDAQFKVINKIIEGEIELMDVDQNTNPYQDCVDEMRELQTPWFLGECIWESYEDLIRDIAMNLYYFKDGEFVPHEWYPINQE